jgi:hypothetical protein
MKRTLEASVTDQLLVSVDAPGDLELHVKARPDITAATAVLSGSEQDLEKVRVSMISGTWKLVFPESAGGVSFSGGGVHIGNVRGGMISVGGGMVVSGSGSIRASGGRTIVNGVDVTDYVREHGGGASEPMTAIILVPLHSRLEADVTAGSITAYGPLASVQAKTASASVYCGHEVGALQAVTISGAISADRAGPAILSSTSGRVELSGARGAVVANTVSGAIRVHALEPIMVNASSVSGNVHVSAERGVRPMVSVSSVSGNVRKP